VPSSPKNADGWRAKLTVLFREQVALYLVHPWILSLPITGSPVTPNSSRWIEAGLESIDELPLTLNEKLAVVLAATGAARWQGMVHAGYDATARETGLSADEVARGEQALYERVVDADEYPLLRALVDAGGFVDESDPFQFGFERTLDGSDAFVSGRAEPDRAAGVRSAGSADPPGPPRDRRARQVVGGAGYPSDA